MQIRILGTGCAKCKKLEENVRAAITALGKEASIEKVTDPDRIMDYGVMITPALVIDEKLVSSGKLLTVDQIIELIKCS